MCLIMLFGVFFVVMVFYESVCVCNPIVLWFESHYVRICEVLGSSVLVHDITFFCLGDIVNTWFRVYLRRRFAYFLIANGDSNICINPHM